MSEDNETPDSDTKRCVDALRYAADQLGHSPSIAEYESLGLTPSPVTIERICGSWNRAKTLAGLETADVGATSKITRNDLATAIEAVAERVDSDIGPETYEANRDSDHPSLPTFYNRTEGFAAFRDRVLAPSNYTKTDIKNSLRAAVSDLKTDQLTVRQYEEWRSKKVDPSKNAIYANPSAPYESWGDALEAADVNATAGQAMDHSQKDLVDAYNRVRKIVGGHPTQQEYEAHRRATDPSYTYLYKQEWPEINSWDDLRRYQSGSV